MENLESTYHYQGQAQCNNEAVKLGAASLKPSVIPPKDPWAHRSDGMRCNSCMWFVVKAGLGNMARPGDGPLGRCRRHAPNMNGFVPVFGNDWCGDHRLDETKL